MGYGPGVGELRFGPARIPSRESPEEAVAILQERGYSACEIDFEGKFWMDYPWAERLESSPAMPGSPFPSTRRSPASSGTPSAAS